MGKQSTKNKATPDTGIYGIIKKFIVEIGPDGIRPESKFNLISTLIFAVFICFLSISPVIAYIENLIIAMGNIFITLFSDRPIIPRTESNALLSTIYGIVFLFIELIICRVYCYFNNKLNSTT